MKKDYKNTIIKHYEGCLDKFGDSHLGVDWPKLEDVNKRYKVMMDIITFGNNDKTNIRILDFGCGASHLYQYISDLNLENITYSGLDISEKFVALSKKKFPSLQFYQGDILEDATDLPTFDFVIMNGVFTEKRELSFDVMWSYFKEVLTKVYSFANQGLAFNVMSKNVEWERDDLFHLPVDLLTDFLTKELSRHFIIRNDYGLYEYTTYLFKK